MLIIEVEIKGNKYSKKEINNMLNDYLEIGENVYKYRGKKSEELLRNFLKKYQKNGTIIIKSKYKKQFLNSAKELYKLAEFAICTKSLSYYDKYIYQLNRNLKGGRVYLYLKGELEIGLIYNSIPSFLENWYILKRIVEV